MLQSAGLIGFSYYAEIVSGFLKAKVVEFLLDLLKTSDAQTIHYNLASMKLLAELIGRLTLTKEERELSSAMTAAKPAQRVILEIDRVDGPSSTVSTK
jgi:hypothetical protein